MIDATHQLTRAAHKPGHDYGSMSEAELLSMRDSMLLDIKRIEKPGAFKRALNWSVKSAAAVGTFAASLWLGDKVYLKEQHDSIAERKSAQPRSEYMEIILDPELITSGDVPEGKRIVWSCANCKCPGGMGGKCTAAYIDNTHPESEEYKDFTVEDLGTYEGKYWEKITKRIKKDGPDYFNSDLITPEVQKQLGITPFDPNPDNSEQIRSDLSHLHRQSVFTASAGVGLAFAAVKALEQFIDKPGKKRAHEMKHEIQHIESELSFRQQISAKRASGQPERMIA